MFGHWIGARSNGFLRARLAFIRLVLGDTPTRPIMSFAEFGLAQPILRAVAAEGYTIPTPIQSQTIPLAIAGRDLLGCAQTGTGKTAAFALPILQRIDQMRRPAVSRSPRVLVLSPTRELAAQIGQSFATYGRNLHFRQT